jgi:hypothetical protein
VGASCSNFLNGAGLDSGPSSPFAAVRENKIAQECGDPSPLIFRAKELYFNKSVSLYFYPDRPGSKGVHSILKRRVNLWKNNY